MVASSDDDVVAVGILGTKDEKAILRNWFSGVIDVGAARVGLEINK